MKAKPYKLENGSYVPCDVNEATHIEINTPGPFFTRILPFILKGKREGTGCWTWNGDVDRPTLKPSIRTSDGQGTVCHTWITDGKVIFLGDSTHEFANQTLDLLEIED